MLARLADVGCAVMWCVVCGGVCVAARCCASVRAVSASVILHGVQMTVQLAGSPQLITYSAAKYAANGGRMAWPI